MGKISKEIKAIDGKEGTLTELVRAFLDAKKAKYSIAKKEPNMPAVYMKDVDPFVEEGSIIIEKDRKRVIIEELTKVCGISGRFHDRDGVDTDAVIDRAKRVLFRTTKGKKDLRIITDLEAKEPTFGLYIGGGSIKTTIKDILDIPSDIPDIDEAYEINCECEAGYHKLKCKGHAWEW